MLKNKRCILIFLIFFVSFAENIAIHALYCEIFCIFEKEKITYIIFI